MIITVFGGDKRVEKSMIAIHLAALGARDHHQVVLIDADPQKHSFLWCLRRGTSNAARLHVPVLPIVDVSLHAELEHLHPRCEDIVIDAGALDETSLRTALMVSHAIVVPACMPPDDLSPVAAALKQAGNLHAAPRVIVVVDQGRDEDISASEAVASQLLAALPSAKLAHAVIHDRASIASAFQQGLTVFETTPVGHLAAAEIEGLKAALYDGMEKAPGTAQEIRAAVAAVETSHHGA